MDLRLRSMDKISALFVILAMSHAVIGLPVVMDLDLFEPLQPVLSGMWFDSCARPHPAGGHDPCRLPPVWH
jgi:hypothetical protein